MKKIFLFLIGSVFCVFVIGCTSSPENDYRKACEEHDFIKAYQIVDDLDKERLNVDDDHYYVALGRADEAKRYVIVQEAMYLLEQGGDANLMRIVGIVKEHEAEWLYDELIDVAQRIGDEELAEKILNMDSFVITLESSSIKGVLNGYFEVVNMNWKVRKSDHYQKLPLVIKKIKNEKINSMEDDDRIGLTIEFMDKDGNVIATEYVGADNALGFNKLNVGDVWTGKFSNDEFKNKNICKFRVISELASYHIRVKD